MKHILIILLVTVFCSVSSALCVKAGKANLRSAPTTKAGKTWEVFKYMPLRKLASKAGWYKVKDFEGDVHWIHGKLITTKYKCAVVKDKANLRSGPGTKYRKTFTAEKTHSFKVLRFKKDWVQILDEYGEKYWVFRKLVWIN
jgi:SH3-like domain-containing protein